MLFRGVGGGGGWGGWGGGGGGVGGWGGSNHAELRNIGHSDLLLVCGKMSIIQTYSYIR